MGWTTSKKMVPGERLTHPQQLMEALKTEAWIYHGERSYHPAFIASWPFRMVLSRMSRGALRWAMRYDNPQQHYKTRAT